MSYVDSVNKIIEIAKKSNLKYEIYIPSLSECSDLFGNKFNDILFKDISCYGYVGVLDIPWSAEYFSIYRFGDLASRQIGYRIEGRTGEISVAWDQDKYVIGDWTGNPISIDDQDGSISYARHGMGKWHYVRIAGNLEIFLDVISEWIKYFVIDNNKNIFDDDFEICKDKFSEIERDVLSRLDFDEKKEFRKFLMG